MRVKLFLAVVAGVIAASPVFARTRTYFDFSIGITHAAPAEFCGDADLFLVPGTRVYVVGDVGSGYHCYRYGNRWYASRGDRWYCADGYRARFRPVRAAFVPRVVRHVPTDWGHGRAWRGHGRGGRDIYRGNDHRDFRDSERRTQRDGNRNGGHRGRHGGRGHRHDA